MLDRVERIASQIIERHGNVFTDSFEENKKILGKIAVIRSKELRNELAGYVTRLVKSEGKEVQNLTKKVFAQETKTGLSRVRKRQGSTKLL